MKAQFSRSEEYCGEFAVNPRQAYGLQVGAHKRQKSVLAARDPSTLSAHSCPSNLALALPLRSEPCPPCTLRSSNLLSSSRTHLPPFTGRLALTVDIRKRRKRRVQTRQPLLYVISFLPQLLHY
jgi:hypothetical protein